MYDQDVAHCVFRSSLCVCACVSVFLFFLGTKVMSMSPPEVHMSCCDMRHVDVVTDLSLIETNSGAD